LSQRVRVPTTDATPMPKPPKASKAPKPSKAPASQKAPKADKKAQMTETGASERDVSAAGTSDLTAQDQSTAPESASVVAAPTLARVLRAVAQEIERDPSLAQRVAASMALLEAPISHEIAPMQTHAPPLGAAPDDAPEAPGEPEMRSSGRVNRSFHPRIVTGAPPELGQGVPDPFALYARIGEAGLRATLNELRLGSLRAIVREHHLDPGGRLAKQNDAARLRALIIGAVLARKQATE